ncbi:MAG: 4Fe-4S dicluster domain-containing protein [Thermodesulfobacteriota bacterium]
MRRFIQILSLLLFSTLFVFATFRLPDWLFPDLYLRLDPLLSLNAIFAARELIPRALWALFTLGATMIVGRFFCGYVCPMGVSLDLLNPLFFRNKKKNSLQLGSGLRRIKYFLLIFFVSAAIVGLSLAFLLDPMAFLTRVYTFFLYPLAITLINLFLDLLRPLFRQFGWMALTHLHYFQPVFYMTSLTLLLFGGILFLNRWASRFWCRYLCPLGALLSLISPLGVFRRRVSEDCNKCMKCQKACPMGAVGENPKETYRSECIQCRTCSEVCPKEAISFSPSLSLGGEYSKVDLSRRGVVFSISGGLVAGFLALQTPFRLRRGKFQLLRPPGAIPEDEFLRTCIRCGECMKSCLTNTLQPSLWESGLSGLWTPKMDLRLAPCDQNCNVCGKVCPTQAIRSLPIEEKNHAKIGTAIIRKELCLVWAQNKVCLICDEICPYNAIVFRPIEGYRRPVVIASKCNGCGYCEQRCPVKGESAILVVPDGEIRLKEGSYQEEARKLRLEFRPDPGDDKFILEKEGLQIEKKERVKPKGFL